MSILIPIEIGKREIFSAATLGINLSRRGFNVILGDQVTIQKLAIKLWGNHVYFDKSLDILKLSFYKKISSRIDIITQDVEWTAISNPSLYIVTRYHLDTLKYAKKVLCSGPFEKKILSDAFPEYRHKFHDIGNYRNSILFYYGYDYFNSKTMDIKNQYGKFNLYISNFGSCLNTNEIPVVEQMINKSYSSNKSDLKDYVNKRQIHRNKRAIEYVKFINRSYKINYDKNIKTVLRLHPTERKIDWINLGVDKGVIFNDTNPILPLILSADLIYHPGCTSAIEAHLLGVKTCYFNNIRNNTYDSSITDIINLDSTDNNSTSNLNIEYYLNYKRNLDDILNDVNIENNQTYLSFFDRLLTIIFIKLINMVDIDWSWKYTQSDHNELKNILISENIKFKDYGKVLII